MIKKIKKLLHLVHEDYLFLDDKLIEIGYLSYKFQKYILSHKLESKLREHIKDATEDIKHSIQDWLGNHGLIEEAESIGGNFSDIQDTWEELYSDILKGLGEKISGACYPDEDDYDTPALKKIVFDLNGYFGGGYFSREVIEFDDFMDWVKDNIEEDTYYDDEDDKENTYFFFDVHENDILNFFIESKRKQVESNSYFMDIVEDMVNATKDLDNIDSLKTNDLILKFDILKDLNHTNGNLLQDYTSINWDDINTGIENKIKGLVNV